MQKFYCEVAEPKRGKLSDTVLIVLAVIVILSFEPALVLVGFPQSIKVTVQSIFCLLLILFCIFFYRKRLRSFRYTYITDREDVLGELEDAPESFSKLKAGTFIAESIIGSGAGTVIAVIEPDEIKGLFSCNEDVPSDRRVSYINASLVSAKKASKLLYEQNDRVYALCITPSKELAELLRVQKASDC